MWCVVYHWHDWVQYTKDPIYTNSEFVLKRESESWKPIIPHDCGIVYRCYSWLNSDNIIKHHDKLPSFEISLTFLAPQTVGLHGAMCEGLKGWISSQRKNLSWFVTFFCHFMSSWIAFERLGHFRNFQPWNVLWHWRQIQRDDLVPFFQPTMTLLPCQIELETL